MKQVFAIAIASIILLGGIVYLLGKSPRMPSATIGDARITPSPSLQEESFLISPADANALKQGGSSFREGKGLYTFLYPNDYKLDAQGDQYVRISKTGATQRGQTEMYDGVIIVFESVDLKGQTLGDWTDARIKESTADGTSEVTQPKKATNLNSYPGFTYTLRGLGESMYLVLQKNPMSSSAVSITFLVADPQNKNYQQEVNAVLSTLELHK